LARRANEKKYQSVSELAEARDLTRSFVSRLLRLTLLAPNIVEAILDGRQLKRMQLEELTGQCRAGGPSSTRALPSIDPYEARREPTREWPTAPRVPSLN
jgi:hypothetical protein